MGSPSILDKQAAAAAFPFGLHVPKRNKRDKARGAEMWASIDMIT